jgi:hypothetical protein
VLLDVLIWPMDGGDGVHADGRAFLSRAIG